MLMDFYSKGNISKGLNATFITLIPKRVVANKITEFRLISLILAPYKIIAKNLANRIREFIHEVVDGNQYAFIKGRQILDTILIVNECVEDYTRREKKGVIVKLDMEKTYDKTDWDFVDYTMARKGFGSK